MSRWGKFQDVADLPVRAFNESKYSRTYEGGGGGGGTTYSEAKSYTSNVPEFAQPFYEEMMQRANLESLQPYSPYLGERVSSFSPLQQYAQYQAAAMEPVRWDAQTAAQYMDPYMQNVVNVQKDKALEDYQRQGAARAAEAVTAGAFGGGREAVREAEAEKGLLSRMNQIQAEGLQQAYGQGMATMQTERALQEAQINLQNAVGAQQQQQAQRELDIAYEDFINARDYDRQQLAFYNAMLRGIPVPVQQETIAYTPSAGVGTQLAGLGIAGLGAYGAMG